MHSHSPGPKNVVHRAGAEWQREIQELPYSAKILRDKIFTEINFADRGFPLATPIFWQPHAQFVFIDATTPCSDARFQNPTVLVRGKLRLGPSRFLSLELINYASVAGDTSWLTNTMDVEGTYKSGPQRSGGVRFEITVQSHVALDVQAIVQKRSSYCFVSRPYYGLPSNVSRSLISRYKTNARISCASKIWRYTVNPSWGIAV